MFRLAISQMRQSAPRLIAAAIAVIIGTAFATLTLLSGTALNQATTTALTARYASADLVVRAPSTLTPAVLDAIREVPGVQNVDSLNLAHGELSGTARTQIVALIPASSDPQLDPLMIVEGRLPVADNEIALPETLATRFSADVGDSVQLILFGPEGDEPISTFTVSGTTEDPLGAFADFGGAAVLQRDIVEPISQASEAAIALNATGLQDVTAVRADIESALHAQFPGTDVTGAVLTTTEVGNQIAANVIGSGNLMMIVFVGVFAAIALLVAGLIIANTFQVLIAQRTRDLALLRAVGAASNQVRNSVLAEALTLGLAASTIGVVLGTALGASALAVASRLNLPLPLPTSITISPAAVLVPLLMGTLVTVFAALAPARAATRVAPLAAMRPLDAPTLTQSAGRVRLVLGLLAVAGGFALLFGALQIARSGGTRVEQAVIVAVAGSVISFIGLLVSAVFWMPTLVGLVGRVIGRTGSTARLAVANTMRNPRRTTATATALLIGSTLIAMMSTGAATASSTLNTVMDETFPIDVQVATDQWANFEVAESLPGSLQSQIAAIPGVARVVPLPGVDVTVSTTAFDAPAVADVAVRAITADDAQAVIRDSALVAGLSDDTVVQINANFFGQDERLAIGDPITLTGPDGSVTLQAIPASDEEMFGYGAGMLITPQAMSQLDSAPAVTGLWVGLADINDAPDVVPFISDAVADSGIGASVVGVAASRAEWQSMIDTALNVVIGLLAAAVVIALIGVANTLSLSAIERQRESATLRAIGLSKAGLRRMLAIEGVLIASVGALLGIVFGLVYGWVGASTILAQAGDVVLGIPWPQISLALAIAIGAGLLASILPGRAAANQKPVAALAAY